MTLTAYQKLELIFKRLSALGEAEAVLRWDMSAIMPCGGAEARTEQLAALEAVQHGLITASEMADLIPTAENFNGELNDWQTSNLHEMKRRWIKATALSEGLVVALSKACSACEASWRTARFESNFSTVSIECQSS